MGDIAAAVAHVHTLGVLHCDIKQENMVLGKDGVARLLDFDSALDMWYAGGYADTSSYDCMATEAVRPPEWEPALVSYPFTPTLAPAGDVFSTSLTALSTLLLTQSMMASWAALHTDGEECSVAITELRERILKKCKYGTADTPSPAPYSCTKTCMRVLSQGVHMLASRRPSAQAVVDAVRAPDAPSARDSLQALAHQMPFTPALLKDQSAQVETMWHRVPVPWKPASATEDAPDMAVVLRNAICVEQAADTMRVWARMLVNDMATVDTPQQAALWRCGAGMLCIALAAVQLDDTYTGAKEDMRQSVGKQFPFWELPMHLLRKCIEQGVWTGLSGTLDNAIALVLASTGGNAAALSLRTQWRMLGLCATQDGLKTCLLHPKMCSDAVLAPTMPSHLACLVQAGVRAVVTDAPTLEVALHCACTVEDAYEVSSVQDVDAAVVDDAGIPGSI